MRIYIVLLMAVLFFVIGGAVQSFGEGEKNVFDVITVDSAITPAVAKYVTGAIDQSGADGSAGIIILLDTPGGLDLAMRDIVTNIGAAHPVAIGIGGKMSETMAKKVENDATNIGAAHPVAIGIGGKMSETMAKKVENDAVAYARGIANNRMRNADWAEEAVKESVSITAEKALELNVIDVIASDMEELLEKIDGTTIMLPSIINKREMGLREKILVTLSNPNIAYLLMMIGLAGLYFEFSNPGAILPGVVGGISLILAFFAMQTLPVNYAGIALIIFGIILFIAEIKIVSHGMLSVAGVISLVLGSVMLFDSSVPALRVSFSVMIPTILTVSLFFIAVVSLAVKAQMKKPFTGIEGMIGREGKTITPVYADGKVLVKGERWNAFSGELIEEGADIRVVGVEGLKLEVEKI
ncbi:MAG: nodulation protein NfeD [Deltaproteobacteria bacterium]|nr:nodulation protein NfeD [Deltaproteobacteria bacterium]